MAAPFTEGKNKQAKPNNTENSKIRLGSRNVPEQRATTVTVSKNDHTRNTDEREVCTTKDYALLFLKNNVKPSSFFAHSR